ncbi:MAG TPA: GNAT family N-acetyltransferase [Ktedonobacterales bacterium]|jgi:ribosomal protein S18 acetylase RimI-like enzyme
MPIRTMRLPADTDVVANLLPAAFQYPENPEWSLTRDEAQAIVDMMRSAKRLGFLLVPLALVSSSLRDAFGGFIWEEDGKPVGLVNVSRLGMGGTWTIGNVAVLPAYRRRGLARLLVEAAIARARERGGKNVVLDVIAGNVPAYELYRRLGFEHFNTSTELEYTRAEAPQTPALPSGYHANRLPLFDWRQTFALTSRITPAPVQRFRPVDAAELKVPLPLRIPFRLVVALSGSHPEKAAVVADSPREVAGLITYEARRRGVNQCELFLDPAHAAIGPYLVARTLQSVRAVSPRGAIQVSIPTWEQPLLDAALAVGFEQRLEMHSLGMVL